MWLRLRSKLLSAPCWRFRTQLKAIKSEFECFRLLGAFRACWLRKERLETEQLEQLEAGVFSAGAKHRPAWHQYSRKEGIHPAFYMPCSTFPLLGAEAEVTGPHSCTWNSAERGLGQRRAISSIPINPRRPLPSWQYARVPVLSPPSTENKPSVSSGGGGNKQSFPVVLWVLWFHFLTSVKNMWRRLRAEVWIQRLKGSGSN